MIQRIIRKFRSAYNVMYNKPIGEVYMLHRVCPFEEGKLSANENMKVTPEFLEQFIVEHLPEYDFFSLDQVAATLNKKRKPTRPFIAFTLDDGYQDNYNYAFPIFRKYQIPFAIYVSTGFVDGVSLLWWYQLEDIILKNNSITLSNGECFSTCTMDEKENSFLQIRKIILELPSVDFDNKVRELLSAYALNFEAYSEKLMLSWNQILEMSQHPLCTIAAHTVTHRRMSELTTDDLLFEIAESKRTIELKIKKDVLHFAYPFGSGFEVNEKVVTALQRSEYSTACLAYGGVIRKKDNDLFRLKRTMLSVPLNT